jgi:hypothetical protein
VEYKTESIKEILPKVKTSVKYNPKYDYPIRDHVKLHAFYVIEAINRFEALKNVSKSSIHTVRNTFYWAFTWQRDYEREGIFNLETRLREVNENHLRDFNEPYSLAWILDFDDLLYEKLIQEYCPYLASGRNRATAQEITEV